MSTAWVELPGGERLHLRYSVFTGVLRVYHRDEQVAEVIPSGEIAPNIDYTGVIKEVGFAKEGASDGTVKFNLAERLVEIDSRLVKIKGIPSFIYQQCEVIVRVEGMTILKRRFF